MNTPTTRPSPDGPLERGTLDRRIQNYSPCPHPRRYIFRVRYPELQLVARCLQSRHALDPWPTLYGSDTQTAQGFSDA
jgi:hypothetical protein